MINIYNRGVTPHASMLLVLLFNQKKNTGLFQQTIKQKPNGITEVTKSPSVNRFYKGLNRSLHIPPLT